MVGGPLLVGGLGPGPPWPPLNTALGMGSHLPPAEVIFPPLFQPFNAGTRFSDPGVMQG